MKDHPQEWFFDTLPQECLLRGEELAKYTTIKCGGPAWALMEVRDADEAAQALEGAKLNNIPTLIIGNGSNLLIDDEGFDGLVLHFGAQYAQVTHEGDRISAQAGASLMNLSRLAADLELSGLEFAAGIPASVGGAALMNAGAYGGEMSRVVHSVDCLDSRGEPITLSNEEIQYSYRHSRMMQDGYTVLTVHLELAPADREGIIARMQENNAQRRLKQPLTYPSAGSFFKRPEGHFAGALIEQAGLKGATVGGAQVSQLHAGFLINIGDARARDFRQLVAKVQGTVEDMFGVQLEPEVRMIFKG